jgi:hypothetical protein
MEARNTRTLAAVSRRWVLLSGLVLAAVIATSTSAAGVAGLPAWDWVPAQSPGDNARLLDVVDLGAGDVHAVGNAATEPLAERWNGSAFVTVPIVGLAGRNDVLEGVDGVARNELWAVGHADRIDVVGSLSLTYRWNGASWTRIPSPNSGNSESRNDLLAVAVVSSTDAWAVGQFVDVSLSRALTLHWDGTAWRRIANSCGSGLNGVTALASNDVWAVGGNVLCHWNGTRWTPQTAPQLPNRTTDLQDVDGLPDALWAVGLEFASCGEGVCPSGIVLRRSGTSWVREVEGYGLYGISVLSATDAWAVGAWAHGPLLLHRDASSWQPAPTPDTPGIGSLAGIDASAPDSLWAVGKQLIPPSTSTLALHAPSARSGAVDGQTSSHSIVTWFGPESGSIEADQFGHFQLGGLTAGRYTFFASQQGCSPASRRIRIIAGTTKTLTLTPIC